MRAIGLRFVSDSICKIEADTQATSLLQVCYNLCFLRVYPAAGTCIPLVLSTLSIEQFGKHLFKPNSQLYIPNYIIVLVYRVSQKKLTPLLFI